MTQTRKNLGPCLLILAALTLLASRASADEALMVVKGCSTANFGDWGINDGATTIQKHLGIMNDGDATGVMVITAINITGDAGEFVITDTGNDHLGPQEGRVVSFRFDPASQGLKVVNVEIVTTNGGTVTCQVTGNGTLESVPPRLPPPPHPIARAATWMVPDARTWATSSSFWTTGSPAPSAPR